MIIRRAFRFRLEPTAEDQAKLSRFAGACRWAWNRALAEQRARMDSGRALASYPEMCKWLTNWRHDPETAWLAEIHVHPVQQKLKDLERAFKDFFRRPSDPCKRGLPRFKKKYASDSFRYPTSIKAEIASDGWGRVWLPKIGWVRYRASREILGRIAQATVTRDGEHWFVCIQTEREEFPMPAPGLPPVGIDLGISRFATLSNGDVLDGANAFEARAAQIARAQRNLARKYPGSANWRKQVRQIAKLRRRERRARLDQLHKASSAIARAHPVVAMENLSVKRMSRSAKGSPGAPGRHVRAKASLNRRILDQGWFKFRKLLEYKLLERGGRLILVDPKHTSQRCSHCGYRAGENRESQANFVCKGCGHREHADLNAARNILLAAGQAATACGGIGHGPPDETGTHGVIA